MSYPPQQPPQQPPQPPYVYTVKRPRIGWSPARTAITVAAIAVFGPCVLFAIVAGIAWLL